MRKVIRKFLLVVLVALVLLVGLSFVDIPALSVLASYRAQMVDGVSSWWEESFPLFPYDVVNVESWIGGDGRVEVSFIVTVNQQTELGKMYCLRDTEFTLTASEASYGFLLYIPPEEAEPLVRRVRQRLTDQMDLLLRQRDQNALRLRELQDDYMKAYTVLYWERRGASQVYDMELSITALKSTISGNATQARGIKDKLGAVGFVVDVQLTDLAPFLACRKTGGDND